MTQIRAPLRLVQYRSGYRPTRAERRELDEEYADLYPELAPFFTRQQLVGVIERLLRASRDEKQWYQITDAEEKAPGQLQPTHEAWKIAAGLKPQVKDLQLTPVERGLRDELARRPQRRIPASGYVGPYPLREREDLEDE